MPENTSLEVRNIEKRELNHIVNSYTGNKNELLHRVPELIDWDMFHRKISPELVEVLQLQYQRLKKRGVKVWIQENGMKRGFESGKVYYLQTESRYQDGPYSIYVFQKKTERYKQYRHENENSIWFSEKGWVTYFVRQEPGEEKKISSENLEFAWLPGSYGRVSEYQLEQNFQQVKVSFWTLIGSFWVGAGLISGAFYYLLYGFLWVSFPALPENIMLGGSLPAATCLDVVLRIFLIKIFLRYRRRVKSHRVLQSIRQQWPDFCMEKFIAMASNRLKCIFFADSMAQIGEFVSCDLTNILTHYANVIDCVPLDFRFEGMSRDENYYYIDVRQKVLLTRDLGRRTRRKKLTVNLRFMRPKESIMSMDFYRDWYIGEMKV